MIQKFGSLAKPPLRILQGRIHSYQRIIEARHRAGVHPLVRRDLFERLATGRHETQLNHNELSYTVWQPGAALSGRSAVQNTS